MAVEFSLIRLLFRNLQRFYLLSWDSYSPAFVVASNCYRPVTLTESEQPWRTLYTLGADDGAPLENWAVTRLFELGIAEKGDDGPQLTTYGEKCFVVIISDRTARPRSRCTATGWPRSSRRRHYAARSP
jgi:hypothetical protein